MKLNEERQRRAGADEKPGKTEGKKNGAKGANGAKGKAANAGGAEGIEAIGAVGLDGDVHPSRRNRLLPT